MGTLAGLAALALAAASFLYYGANPRVVVYLFVLAETARLVTVRIFHFLHGRFPNRWPGAMVRSLTSRPAVGDEPEPLVYEEGGTVPLRMYLLLLASLAWISFVFLHSKIGGLGGIDWGVFRSELLWAAELTLVYWLGDLFAGNLKLDPDLSSELNLGFHAKGIRVLAIAVLVTGFSLVVTGALGWRISPWLVCGPLLVLKFLFDRSEARNRGT